MPTVGAAVSPEVKDRFEEAAKTRCITSSRLAASLITEFLKRETEEEESDVHGAPPDVAAHSVMRHGTKNEQVFVRLDAFYFAELGRLASERNWYRSTYLANLLQAHVDRSPVLCEIEINALRQVARQLADIGRCLNQITRRLNASLEHAHLISSLDFELLKMLVDLEVKSVKALLAANLKGWGIDE